MAYPLTSITSNATRDQLITMLQQVVASTARVSDDPLSWTAEGTSWVFPLAPIGSDGTQVSASSSDKVSVFRDNGRVYYNLSEGEGLITLMVPQTDREQTGWDAPVNVGHCLKVCTQALSALRALDVRFHHDQLVFGYDMEPWKVALTLLAETNHEGTATKDLLIHLPTPWTHPRIVNRNSEPLCVDEALLADYDSRMPASCEIVLKSAGPFHQLYIGANCVEPEADMQWASSPVARMRAIAAAVDAGAIAKPAA